MHICFDPAIPALRNISEGKKSVDLFKHLIVRMFLAMFIVQISIRYLLSARREEKNAYMREKLETAYKSSEHGLLK